VLTVTGMLGMISIFAANSPTPPNSATRFHCSFRRLGDPRLMQAMKGEPVSSLLLTALVLLVWSATFFIIGVLRFNRRYA